MFVQDHHSLEELQRLTKALRLETGTDWKRGRSYLLILAASPFLFPRPVVHHPRRGNSEPPYLTTYLFGSSLTAS